MTKDTGLYYYIPHNLSHEDIQMMCSMLKAYPMYVMRHAMEKNMWDKVCQSRPELKIHSLYQQKYSAVKHGIRLERKFSAQ
jgi:hypothetical protein